MTSFLMAAVLHTAMFTVGVEATPISSESYSEARETVDETGKPLVVMVSTDWCPPCQTMKKTVMPRVRDNGTLRKVVFAMVNPDRESELAKKLIGGGPIPQLLMFRKKGDGWVKKSLVGGQSVESVEQFINDGVAEAETGSTSTTDDTSAKDPEKSEPATNPSEVARDDRAARHG